MTYRFFISLIAALVLVGCKTSASAEAEDTEASAPKETEAATGSTEPGTGAQSLEIPSLEGAPPAVRVDSGDDEFRIAHSDGTLSTWQIVDEAASATTSPVRDDSTVLAWSPAGVLAVASGNPPVVIRLDDNREVLRFIEVDEIETAGFFRDGSGLFIGEANGKLHVWNESEQTLESVPTQDIESFMARQSPSFTANFNSLSGRATATGSNKLLLGTQSGKLYLWDPDDPTNVQTLVKLGGPIRDTAYSGGRVYATTHDGEFRAADASNRVFLDWTTGARGDYVAAAASAPGRVMVADGDSVRMLEIDEGQTVWSRSIDGDASICGLALSDDGEVGAACIDGAIIIFDTRDGTTIGQIP